MGGVDGLQTPPQPVCVPPSPFLAVPWTHSTPLATMTDTTRRSLVGMHWPATGSVLPTSEQASPACSAQCSLARRLGCGWAWRPRPAEPLAPPPCLSHAQVGETVLAYNGERWQRGRIVAVHFQAAGASDDSAAEKMLQSAAFLAIVAVDTPQNELSKVT